MSGPLRTGGAAGGSGDVTPDDIWDGLGEALVDDPTRAADLTAILRGAVVDPLTSAGSWTASAGTSGRGSATFGGGGLALGITVGAGVPHDSGGGFTAPNASKALPVGGVRGVRVTMTYAGLSNADNRLALMLRDSARGVVVAVQIKGDTQAVEYLTLAPGVGGVGPGGTGSRAAGALCLEVRTGSVTAYYATTATPGESDWLFGGVADMETAVLVGAPPSHTEIALATYAGVASSATVTSFTVESLA